MWFPGLVRWISAAEPDWDAIYAERLPQVSQTFPLSPRGQPRSRRPHLADLREGLAGAARYRRDIAGFATWLMSIARNVTTDHFRAARRDVPLEDAAGHARRVA